MSMQPGSRDDPRYAALVAQYGPSARVPVNTSVIEYACAPKQRFPTVLQFFLGMAAPLVYGALAAFSLVVVQSQNDAFFALLWLHPIIFLGSVIYLRVKFKWRAFLAGVLTVILALPLGVGVVCAVICGTM